MISRFVDDTRAFSRRTSRAVAAIALLSLLFVFAGTAVFADAKSAGERDSGESPEEPLTVGAVQFEMDEELVHDESAFIDEVHDAVDEAVAGGSDLVVFPEYVNVFPALSEHLEFLAAVEAEYGSGQGLEYVLDGRGGWKRSPVVRMMGMLKLHTGYDSLRELFLDEADDISRFIDRVYGTVADEHNVHVVAGSYFAADIPEPPDDNASGNVQSASLDRYSEQRLTNRLVVYGPDGERVYEQDKVFLTDFEREFGGLDAGDPEDAEGIEIDGWSVGLTICRDTYFDEWNEVHADRDVWIDLRGEGTEYDESVRDRLERAIPERLADTGVPYGLTLFLTGEFYGLFWEGRSNVLDYTGEDAEHLQHADTSEGYDVLITELQPWE